MQGEGRIRIAADEDVVLARQRGRELAAAAGFSQTDATLIATAISELVRNILAYAGNGEIELARVRQNGREGVVVVAADSGPGIGDLDAAMQEGFSTAGGLGMGLPGARRLVDEFDIVSEVGRGTTVTLKKWRGIAA